MFNLFIVPEAAAGQDPTPVTVSLKLISPPTEVVKSDFFAAVYWYFKRFDYWTNLSYPFYLNFVILSEQNLLAEFQKGVILIEKMGKNRSIYNEQ